MRRNSARRGRGRGGTFQSRTTDSERESALQRLGKVVYPKGNNNDRNTKTKYKFVRSQVNSSAIVTLPAEKRIETLSRKFLKSYYEVFDAPGRLSLETNYSEDAFFSISSTHPLPLIHFGRNLLVVREPDQRISMLFDGRPKIAEVLAKLTPTEHLVDQLTVDVPYYTANPMAVTCLQLVVTGTFKDTAQTTDPLRAFTRIFVLKHTSTDASGEPIYQIFNDMFMIQAPTQEQIKRHLTATQGTKRLGSYQHQQQLATSSSTNNSPLYGKNTREQQIVSIMSKTSMNRIGSTQLLKDCDWDEEKSLATFNLLYPQNKIPPAFFTK